MAGTAVTTHQPARRGRGTAEKRQERRALAAWLDPGPDSLLASRDRLVESHRATRTKSKMPAFLGFCYKERKTAVSPRRLMEHWSKAGSQVASPQQGAFWSCAHQTLLILILSSCERGQSGSRGPPAWGTCAHRWGSGGIRTRVWGDPVLKAATAPGVSCTSNFIGCYISIGKNTGAAHWNFTGCWQRERQAS